MAIPFLSGADFAGNISVTGTSFLDGLVTIDHNLNIQNNGVLKIGGTEVISAGRGISATSGDFSTQVTISGSTNKSIILDYTGGAGTYSYMSFKQTASNGTTTEQFRVWGSYADNYLSFYNDQANVHQLKLNSDGTTTFADDVITSGSINVNRLAGGTPYDNFKISTADIVTTLERVENTGDANAGYGRLDFKTNAATGHTNAGRGGFKFIAGDNNDILYLDNKDKSATFESNITGKGYLNLSNGYGSANGIYLYGNPAMWRENTDNLRFPLDVARFNEIITAGNQNGNNNSSGAPGRYATGILDLSHSGFATGTNYFRIETNIPFNSGGADFTVTIEGFRYGSRKPVNLTICWHIYPANTPYNHCVISHGGWSPVIKMARNTTTNNVTLLLESPGYWPKMYVKSLHSSNYEVGAYAKGWTWANGDLSSGYDIITTIPYQALSLGNGGINNGGNINGNTITGTSLVKSGGTSSQFLMADGSVSTALFNGGTITDSLLIDYTGNDGNGNDAGLKIMNDSSDWGAYIRKDSNADYGLRIDSGGANAFSIYSTTGGSTKVFGVNGSNGSTDITGDFTATGNSRKIRIVNTGNNQAVQLLSDSSGDGQLRLNDSTGATKIFFYGEANQDNYVNNGGKLAVGTASPQEKLHVYHAGTARVEVEGTSGPAAFKATNSQGSFGWYIPSDANEFRLWNFGTSADIVEVDASGNVTANSFSGDGSNLTNVGNADTVDNVHASSFLRSDATDTSSGKLTFGYSLNNLNSVGGAIGVTPFRASFQAANRPGSGNYFTGHEYTFSDSGARAQLGFGSDGQNTVPHIYARTEGWSGQDGWKDWYRIYHTGYHPEADKWTTARTVSFAGGDVSGSFSIDGSADVSNVNLTVADDSHNHDGRYYTESEIDLKFTSSNGSEDEWKFILGDESNMSGNKWYKVATINQGAGGLHIKGSFSNHVESFGTQHIDLLLQGREGNDGDEIEINGTVNVIHNAGSGTDKVGIRVIEADTSSSQYYHYYDVYMRTTRYTQAKFHLTKFGTTGFHTSKPSVTTEPSPASGGSVELDTSTLASGNHVIVDSAVKSTIADSSGNASFTGDVTVTGGDITLGTDSIASNINAVGDVLAFKVDSNENTGGTPNIQFKVGSATELTINGSTASFTGDINATSNGHEFGTSVFKAPDATASILQHLRCSDGNNAATFRTTTTGRIFEIRSQNSGTIKIDSSSTSFTGDVTVTGDLNITGDINSTSVTNLDVDDKTITIAKGAADSAAADGAGIVVDGASASLLYDHDGTQWEFNKPVEVSGQLTSGRILATASGSGIHQLVNASTNSTVLQLITTGDNPDLALNFQSDHIFNSNSALHIQNNDQPLYLKGSVTTVGTTTSVSGYELTVAHGPGKSIRTSGTISTMGGVEFNTGLIKQEQNIDVDSAAPEVVASVTHATYTAAFFDYVIKKGTNVRAGVVTACHDGTNVEYAETSTVDLGDTSDVTLSVDISGNDMRLMATTTSNDWSVKSLIRAI
tara:strand:+ start:1959 stop:6473 length:4515 start_codon:yes stop_codon:yes gene_type:complete